MPTKPQLTEDLENSLSEHLDWLIEQLATAEISVIDSLGFNDESVFKNRDCKAFIDRFRVQFIVMHDPRIAARLNSETAEMMKRETRDIPNPAKALADIRYKDGLRLFKKYVDGLNDSRGDDLNLITGTTFAECLSQYQALSSHVEALWDEALERFTKENYPLATFFSILTIEEIGKLSCLWRQLLSWDQPKSVTNVGGAGNKKRHAWKHLMGIAPGSIINSRLDRLIGKAALKLMLQDAESGKIERIRQSCLYIDSKDGAFCLPREQVDAETAKLFVAFSGEMLVELLGHFPWEFYRMLEKVQKAELALGYPEEIVKPYQAASSDEVVSTGPFDGDPDDAEDCDLSPEAMDRGGCGRA